MFIVYSKPNCPYCDQAKALLERRGEPYEVVMLDVGQQKKPDQKYITKIQLFEKFPNARTVPQIVKTNDLNVGHVGGYNELRTLFESNAVRG